MSTNPALLAVISLRSLALAASLAGRPSQAQALYGLADLVASGVATDAHMQEVADKLASRELTEADWVEVHSRIATDSARLQSG